MASGCSSSSNGGLGAGLTSSSGSGGGLGQSSGSAFGSSGDDGGGTSSGLGGGGSGSGSFTTGGTDASGPPPTCSSGTGWSCSVDKSCATSSPTTLKGKVFDPAGKNPLYNALVFIPNVVANLPAITPGTKSCNTCDASVGDYVAITQTNYQGEFTLTNVPTGTDVPITVQMGKWRRTVSVKTTSCATTTVSDGTVRLPGNKSEGDMPQMALLTGGCDDMACFLTGIGISPSEFTAPMAGGRVDVYQGLTLAGTGAATLSNGTAGDCTTSACPLWQSKSSFEPYDIALFSCECNEHAATKPASALTALTDWLDEGGKVFASHYQYYWFQSNPDANVAAVATWNVGSTVANPLPATFDINNATSFPKGVVFGEWLGNLTPSALASTGTPDTISLDDVANSVTAINAQTAENWIYAPAGDGATGDVKYMSFDTPIGGAAPAGDASAESTTKNYCGKAVFTDLHTGGSLLAQYNSIPADCPTNATLSAQQAAVEFLFFDLSACVTDDKQPPPPPPPPPPQ